MWSTLLGIVKVVGLFLGTVCSTVIVLQLFYHTMLIQHCSVDPLVHISQVSNWNIDNVVISTKLSTCTVYSDTYNIARQRFRNTVQSLPDINSYRLFSLNIDTFEVSEGSTSTNSDDDTATNTIDIAVVTVRADDDGNDATSVCNKNTKSNNDGIVVHISGTHGIEGYAGSAIQIGYLQHLITVQEQRRLQKQSNVELPLTCSNNNNDDDNTVTVILIHAFNPYGMKHYRRVNEHNIDLNRNGLVGQEEWDQVVHGNHYNTQNYTTIVANQLLTKPSSSTTNMFMVRLYIVYERYLYSWIRMTLAVFQYGIPTIKAALVGGQYHMSDGLFYGGGTGSTSSSTSNASSNANTNEPSLIIVRQWMEQFLHERRRRGNSSSNKVDSTDSINPECITWIDVHTGLGPMGVDTLLFGNTIETIPDPNDVQKWFRNSLLSSSTASSSSTITDDIDTAKAVQQGYERVVGYTMDYYYSTVFPKSQFTNSYNLFFVQEFGTVPSILTGNALVVEHEIYNYMSNSSSHQTQNDTVKQYVSTKYSKDVLGSAFYPQRTEWRVNVLQRGILVLQRAIQRSKHYSNLDDSIIVDDHESNNGIEGHKIRPDPSQNVDDSRSEL